MKKINIDLEKLKLEYLENKKNTLECASIFGVTESVIRRRLKELDIKTRSSSESVKIKTNIDNTIIIDLYWKQGLSISEVAKKLNKSDNFVKTRLRESGAGLRSVSEGAKKWRKTDHISDEQIIDLYENKKWSTYKISRYFNKSPDFARQRLITIGHKRRTNEREYNGSWKGDITDIKDLIRTGQKTVHWRNMIFKRANYKSEITNSLSNRLECHHITPFAIILKSSLTKHKILENPFKNLAIFNDERFYDLENGLCMSEDEHHLLEQTPKEGHPWWRIWRCFSEFAINKNIFNNEDFILFNNQGQIDPKNSIITESSKKEVSQIIRYEHYIGTIVFRNFILISKINNIITGIAIFGPSLNPRYPSSTIELTRLCIPYYVIRPFGVDFLHLCYKHIKDHHPEIRQLISFADPSVGHNGGIYRMAGWQKDGHGEENYAYFDTINNKLKHKTSCRRIRGIDKTEKQLAEEKGFIKIPLPPKYRYIYNLY